MSLTRKDLRGFDRLAQEMILEAQEQGVWVKISNRNHAILRSKNGASTSISRRMHAGSRTLQNCRADLKKVIADHCGS